jgi:hypothetical protein
MGKRGERLDRLEREIAAIGRALEIATEEPPGERREEWLDAVRQGLNVTRRHHADAVEEERERPTLRVIRGGLGALVAGIGGGIVALLARVTKRPTIAAAGLATAALGAAAVLVLTRPGPHGHQPSTRPTPTPTATSSPGLPSPLPDPTASPTRSTGAARTRAAGPQPMSAPRLPPAGGTGCSSGAASAPALPPPSASATSPSPAPAGAAGKHRLGRSCIRLNLPPVRLRVCPPAPKGSGRGASVPAAPDMVFPGEHRPVSRWVQAGRDGLGRELPPQVSASVQVTSS